jgi:hypothetical protein
MGKAYVISACIRPTTTAPPPPSGGPWVKLLFTVYTEVKMNFSKILTFLGIIQIILNRSTVYI